MPLTVKAGRRRESRAWPSRETGGEVSRIRLPIANERARGQPSQPAIAVHLAFSRLPRNESAAARRTCHLLPSRLASRTLISSVARPPIRAGRQEAASVVPASLAATETQLSE